MDVESLIKQKRRSVNKVVLRRMHMRFAPQILSACKRQDEQLAFDMYNFTEDFPATETMQNLAINGISSMVISERARALS
jgi:hypothetical protein